MDGGHEISAYLTILLVLHIDLGVEEDGFEVFGVRTVVMIISPAISQPQFVSGAFEETNVVDDVVHEFSRDERDPVDVANAGRKTRDENLNSEWHQI